MWKPSCRSKCRASLALLYACIGVGRSMSLASGKEGRLDSPVNRHMLLENAVRQGYSALWIIHVAIF